ncbi:Rcs stress response system protein RcsF [Pseudidiomarina marina]|uniref:RcsF protein n=1 Tax=Pseudidiomarina marina TaxID=502366 RepID=A0A432YD13_9GAMM|nr:Rcs stress response system protein RcsF [Pseudidiomarina marina]PHR65775.1 MAG: hypothetical protein COA51_04555 [Idiomarina sp.]RUO58869.1 hypothetical protein CWI76_10515 [Pseudidiomarina marina]
MKSLSLVAVLFIIAGCATNQSPVNEVDIAAAETVEFMRPYELSRNDVSFVSLGRVQGESCQANVFSNKPTQQEALLRMKVAAAELGANRLILRRCQQDQTDECRARWICTGDAHQSQPLH